MWRIFCFDFIRKIFFKMLNVSNFFDYSVAEKCLEKDKYEPTIKLLYSYGYRTIAINQTIENVEASEGKKKNKKGETRESSTDVPEPFKIKSVPGCEDMKILNRLTIAFSHHEILHKITKSPHFKKYHVLAVAPTTTEAALFVSSSFDADILSFNPENKSNLKRNRKMFNKLIEKGFHFEIPYSPAIEDTTKRKNIIHMSHLYHSMFKSKNIIISSGATHPGLIRGPYDIINLGLIFGLNELQAKSAITHCGRQVYLNSVGRRHGKAVMLVEKINEEQEKIKDGNGDVILLDSDEEDNMETGQPASKKVKRFFK